MLSLNLKEALVNLDNQHSYNLSYTPCQKALDFYASGLTARQRMWLGGVRTLKTSSILKEVSCHLHGIYPEWWNGYKYDRPTRWLVGTVKKEKTRDVLQKYLLTGDSQFNLKPFIHPSLVTEDYKSKEVSKGFGKIFIRHVSGGISELKFGSFEEGASKHQSETLDGVHIDEAPSHELYMEFLNRTAAFGDYRTFVLISMWPEFGRDELVDFFMNKGSAGESVDHHFYMHSSWSDNPFLPEAEKTRLRLGSPDYLLEAREHGIPIFGVGKVFTVKESDIICPRFEIPSWFRLIAGIDPSATSKGFWGAVLMAYDPDNDVVYVIRDYKKSGLTMSEHCDNLLKFIPSWCYAICDPAGGGEDQATKESALQFLSRHGIHIVKANKAKMRKEAIIGEIEIRMRSDKFKSFETCPFYRDEMRRYSRDEKGRILKENDHTLDASFYALAALSYAKTDPLFLPHMQPINSNRGFL